MVALTACAFTHWPTVQGDLGTEASTDSIRIDQEEFRQSQRGTQLRLWGFPARGAYVTKKRQKSERGLENHYGAVRIKSVAGALEHHRKSDASSGEATKPSKQKRSVLEGIGGRPHSQKSKGRD